MSPGPSAGTPPSGRGFDGPVLVFQMGRVGSRTIVESLARHDKAPETIHHLHHLQGLEAIQETLGPPTATNQPQRTYLSRAIAIRDRLLDDDRRWGVITMVRDPVARNLSMFFYRMRDDRPDTHRRLTAGELGVEELTHEFLENFPHAEPQRWVEEQLLGFFGIDILDHEFPRADGSLILGHDRIELLVLRCEDLPTTAGRALGSFLGTHEVAVTSMNTGAGQPYGAAYRDFLARLLLPVAYVDDLYRTRLASHFYDRRELDAFRRRWTTPGEPTIDATG